MTVLVVFLQFSSGSFAITIQSSGKFAIAPKLFVSLYYFCMCVDLPLYIIVIACDMFSC